MLTFLDLERSCKTLQSQLQESSCQMQVLASEKARLQVECEEQQKQLRSTEDAKIGLERNIARYEAQIEGLSHQMTDRDEVNPDGGDIV